MRDRSTPMSRKRTYGLLGVIEEYFGVIRNPSLLLRLCACAVNAGGSFGGVTAHESEAYSASVHPCAFAGENHAPLLIQQ